MWLTELLERSSREEDGEYADFAPKRASNRNVYQADVAAMSGSKTATVAEVSIRSGALSGGTTS
jgi:hypothetical protein